MVFPWYGSYRKEKKSCLKTLYFSKEMTLSPSMAYPIWILILDYRQVSSANNQVSSIFQIKFCAVTPLYFLCFPCDRAHFLANIYSLIRRTIGAEDFSDILLSKPMICAWDDDFLVKSTQFSSIMSLRWQFLCNFSL